METVDPRNEVVVSEDELTGDEHEELHDLQKEYELRKQEILARKKIQEDLANKFIEGLKTGTRPVKTIDYNNRIFEFDLAGGKSVSCEENDPFTKEPMNSKNFEFPQVIKELTDKKIKLLNVKRCLAKIIKPQYHEPAYDNWAFIGYIVSKSDLLKTIKNETYLRLKIGTFNNTINVNLFGDAYKRYWKMMVGELVIVLNPNIFKNKDGFDFYLTEDWNNMISLGIIKNMGKCNEPGCNRFINNQLKLCEFHEMKQETKFLKNKRMELNGSIKMFNPQERSLNEESRIYTRKSEFDRNKYHDENIFNKTGTKRKLQDEKSNKLLEDRLSKLLNITRYEKIGLLKNVNTQTKINKQKKETNNETLKQELKSLSQAKQMNLGMSRKDKLQKLNKWNENMKRIDLQPIRAMPNQPPKKLHEKSGPSKPYTTKSNQNQNHIHTSRDTQDVQNDSDSGDSDGLTIEFGNSDQLNQYKNIMK